MTKRYPAELRQQAVARRAEGATYNEIASEFGVPYSVARYWTSPSQQAAAKKVAKVHRAADTTRQKAYEKEWLKANPHVNVTNKLRRSGHAPSWLTSEHLDRIRAIYLEGASKGLHVDHIEPLNGEISCGMHVPWNLQLLTPSENISKRNLLY